MFRCVAFLRVFLFLKGVCSGVDSYTGKAPDAHTFFLQTLVSALWSFQDFGSCFQYYFRFA